MILHLLSDPDFDDAIINQFESANCGQNIYVVHKELQYKKLISKVNHSNLIFYKNGLSMDFEKVTGVIIHCLTWDNAKFINKFKKNVPIFWSIFGTDIYNFYPQLKWKIYKKETKKYIYSTKTILQLYYKIWDYKRFLFSLNARDKRKAIKRVNLYSTVIPLETKIVKDILPSHAKFIRLNVGFLVFLKNESVQLKNKSRTNIYVGNSAALASNHLDLLEIFRINSIKDVNVTVQLSYGGNPDYVRKVINEYEKHFQSRFNALTDWLPIEKFNELLDSQNVFIFFNTRQQGVYAILAALWNGGKVFLSENNVTLDYLKSLGVILFSVEEDFLKEDLESITLPLSLPEIIKNREILKQEYSDERIIERTQIVIQEMVNYSNFN